MSSKRCGNGHPKRPGVVCDRPAGPHRLCSGFDEEIDSYVDWHNPLWNDDKSVSRDRAANTIQQMALRLKPKEH